MTSPAMCSWDPNLPFSWGSVTVRYLTGSRKFETLLSNGCSVVGSLHEETGSQEARFDSIASHFVEHMHPGDYVQLEGYAFGAKGQVFHIGECAGLLKHKMWASGVEFDVLPPTALKKFAAGKGNADKSAMNDAFVAETGYDVRAALGCTDKQWNPSSDVVDAYYLCKYAALHGNFERAIYIDSGR